MPADWVTAYMPVKESRWAEGQYSTAILLGHGERVPQARHVGNSCALGHHKQSPRESPDSALVVCGTLPSRLRGRYLCAAYRRHSGAWAELPVTRPP